MKIIKFKIKLLFFLIISLNSLSEEIQIESSNMNIIDNGNTVLADNAEITIPSENIFIKSNNLEYDKNKKKNRIYKSSTV